MNTLFTGHNLGYFLHISLKACKFLKINNPRDIGIVDTNYKHLFTFNAFEHTIKERNLRVYMLS